MTTAIGYVRVSTDEQALGPAAQEAAIRTYCAGRYELAAVHSDLGVSGATPIDKRPGMLAAVAAVRSAGKGAVLVVAKRDRLARDVVILAMLERDLAKHGAKVESADGVGAGDGPEAALMRRIVDAMAEYERALIRLRTKAGLAVKRARGERVSRFPPFGWRHEAGRCVPVASEQAALVAGKALAATGLSAGRVVTRLRKQGLVTGPGRGLIKALRAG